MRRTRHQKNLIKSYTGEIDRHKKKLKPLKISVFLIVLVSLFAMFAGGYPSVVSEPVIYLMRPLWKFTSGFSDNNADLMGLLTSKSTLISDNKQMAQNISELKLQLKEFDAVLRENDELNNLLGRTYAGTSTTAFVLAKPSRTPYDTLIIDVGSDKKIKVDNLVLATNHLAIGHVVESYAKTSKVELYSTPNKQTNVLIAVDTFGKSASSTDVFATSTVIKNGTISVGAIGRGNGNFLSLVPRDVSIKQGAEVYLPSVPPSVIGYVEFISSKPTDSFKKILFKLPINITELKWVQVVNNSLIYADE